MSKAGLDDKITFHLIGWKNWQKGMRKTSSGKPVTAKWYARSNTYYYDEVISVLNDREKVTFDFLCCECSRYTNGTSDVFSAYRVCMQRVRRLSKGRLLDSLNILQDHELIKFECNQPYLTLPNLTLNINKKKDSEIEEKPTKQTKPKEPPIPYKQLASKWDEITKGRYGGNGLELLTPGQKNKIKFLWQAHDNFDYWENIFEYAATMEFKDFMLKDSNGKEPDWMNFYFIFKTKENHLKLLAGEYTKTTAKPIAETYQDYLPLPPGLNNNE